MRGVRVNYGSKKSKTNSSFCLLLWFPDVPKYCKKICDFSFPPVFFNVLIGLWGFNYSKTAKIRFLIDSNTFWMILGTFEIFDFWTRSGPSFLLFLMEIFENSGKILEHLGKSGFWISQPLGIPKFLHFLDLLTPHIFLYNIMGIAPKNIRFEVDCWCFFMEEFTTVHNFDKMKNHKQTPMKSKYF